MIKHFDTDKKLRTKVIRKHRSNHPKWKKASIAMFIILIITFLVAVIASYYFEINSFGFNREVDKIMILTSTLGLTILFSVPNLFYYRHMRFKVCNDYVDYRILESLIFDQDKLIDSYYTMDYEKGDYLEGFEIDYRSIEKMDYNPMSYKVRLYGKLYDTIYKDIPNMDAYEKSINEISSYMDIYMYFYDNEEIMRLLEEKSNKKIEITDEW